MIEEILATAAANPTVPVVCDTETTGLDPWRGDVIRDIQIGIGDRIWHLPVTRPHSDNVPRAAVIELLEKLGATAPLWVMANAKYDLSMIEADFGIDTGTWPVWDVLVGCWLEDENHPHRKLKDRCSFLFGPEATAEQGDMRRLCDGPTLKTLEDALYAASRLFGATKVTRAQCLELARQRPEYGRREMWDLTATEIAPYAVKDIELTTRLYRYQMTLDHKHPVGVAMPREMEVMRCLMDMERVGTGVDRQAAELAHARAAARLEELSTTFAGINPNSHDQLVDLVYNKWEFPVFKKSPKTGSPSVDRESLELLGDDPRITDLLEWRRLSKDISGYYTPLLHALDDRGRIHPSFNAAKVKTGRFSCSRPALQTIPREDTSAAVRQLFRPAPGYELIGYDLAQAEVRVAAALSAEPGLSQAFTDHTDVYALVAKEMGVSRHTAKTVVLANNYGAGPLRLAATLLKGTGRRTTPADVRKAEDLQHRLAKAYPRMAAAARRLEERARTDGRFPLPPPGRYRHFRGAGHAPEEYRKAWNSACQGVVAETVKSLMVEMRRAGIWDACGARPLLQIHDELVAEVPRSQVDRLWQEMQVVLNDVNPTPSVRHLIEVKPWN